MSSKIVENNYHFPASCIGILADLWAKDGVNQKDLGSSLIKTKSTINKMLAALEEDQLIEKRDDPNDKRSKLIFLTPKGKKMQNKIENTSCKYDDILLDKVSDEDLATTKKVLAQYYELLLNEEKQK
jgi:DNA-binding MarR family transcriptional regulator